MQYYASIVINNSPCWLLGEMETNDTSVGGNIKGLRWRGTVEYVFDYFSFSIILKSAIVVDG
jgi:hypothetical protein